MKRIRETDEVVDSIKRLLSSKGSQLVTGDRLQRALIKYENARAAGNGRRLVKAASEICLIVCEEYRLRN